MISYVKNLTKQFQQKRLLYEDFCSAIGKLLASLLEQRGYKYQIYYRVKDPARLREKIIRKRRQGKLYRNLSDIEDLSGVRIIFYLECDREKFRNDLEENLPNIAYVEKPRKKNGYSASHVIAMLDEEKLMLDEYKNFRNLKCEIQLTSIFNHVWSELEHDWIYKDTRRLKNRDPYKYGLIKKQMEAIFKNYIKKLTSNFEKIAKQMLK